MRKVENGQFGLIMYQIQFRNSLFLLVKIAFLFLRKKRICPHEVKISSGSIANVSISARSLIVIDCRSSRIQIDSLKYQFLENRNQQ